MRNRVLLTLGSVALLSLSATSVGFAAETAPAADAARTAPAADAAKTEPAATSVFRMPLGDVEVIAVSDGAIALPMDQLMSAPERVRALLAKAGKTLPVTLSINAYVIKANGKHILVDAGCGGLFGGGATGNLTQSLKAAGLTPEQIDAVLITHMHGDHMGGIVRDGQRVFSNATVYVEERDPAHWLSAEAEKAAPEQARDGFRNARIAAEPYKAAGKLKTFSGATQLFPGVRTVPTPGHTPGHTAYMVESKGQRLLLWGDVLHVEDVQFAEPEITVDFDVNSPAAKATRLKQLADAASGGYLVGSAHITFPGIGHIRKEGKGYAWVPVKKN